MLFGNYYKVFRRNLISSTPYQKLLEVTFYPWSGNRA